MNMLKELITISVILKLTDFEIIYKERFLSVHVCCLGVNYIFLCSLPIRRLRVNKLFGNVKILEQPIVSSDCLIGPWSVPLVQFFLDFPLLFLSSGSQSAQL